MADCVKWVSRVTVPGMSSQSPERSGSQSPSQTPRRRRVHRWPVLLLCLPASVAIWGGWVGLGGLTGFGTIHPLPGIAESITLDMAVTLPIGMESYAAYALYVWLTPHMPTRARRFARWSALLALLVGAAGQIAYHLMTSLGIQAAPWWITTIVSCVPVTVVALGGSLIHLLMDKAPDEPVASSSSTSQRRPSWIVRAAGDIRQAADELRTPHKAVRQSGSQPDDEAVSQLTDSHGRAVSEAVTQSPDSSTQSVSGQSAVQVTPPTRQSGSQSGGPTGSQEVSHPVTQAVSRAVTQAVTQSPDLGSQSVGESVSQLTAKQEQMLTTLLTAYGDSPIPGRPAVMTRMGWTNAGLTGRLLPIARKRQSGSQAVS